VTAICLGMKFWKKFWLGGKEFNCAEHVGGSSSLGRVLGAQSGTWRDTGRKGKGWRRDLAERVLAQKEQYRHGGGCL